MLSPHQISDNLAMCKSILAKRDTRIQSIYGYEDNIPKWIINNHAPDYYCVCGTLDEKWKELKNPRGIYDIDTHKPCWCTKINTLIHIPEWFCSCGKFNDIYIVMSAMTNNDNVLYLMRCTCAYLYPHVGHRSSQTWDTEFREYIIDDEITTENRLETEAKIYCDIKRGFIRYDRLEHDEQFLKDVLNFGFESAKIIYEKKNKIRISL